MVCRLFSEAYRRPRLATAPTRRPRRNLSPPGISRLAAVKPRLPRSTRMDSRPESPVYPGWQPAPAPAEPPRPREPERAPLWKRLAGPLVAAGLLLVKFGAKLKGLLLLLPKLKLF